MTRFKQSTSSSTEVKERVELPQGLHDLVKWDFTVMFCKYVKKPSEVHQSPLCSAKVTVDTALYRVIQNECWGFNNFSYTIHLR